MEYCEKLYEHGLKDGYSDNQSTFPMGFEHIPMKTAKQRTTHQPRADQGFLEQQRTSMFSGVSGI